MTAEACYATVAATDTPTHPKSPCWMSLKTVAAPGVIAGVASAIISHPADTLLSKVNKAGAGE